MKVRVKETSLDGHLIRNQDHVQRLTTEAAKEITTTSYQNWHVNRNVCSQAEAEVRPCKFVIANY